MSELRTGRRQSGSGRRPGESTTIRALVLALAVVVAVLVFAHRGGVEDAVAERYPGLEVDCSKAGTIAFQGSDEAVYVCQRRDMAQVLGCYVYMRGELYDVSGEVRRLARMSSEPMACG